jgi:hypothetical protein
MLYVDRDLARVLNRRWHRRRVISCSGAWVVVDRFDIRTGLVAGFFAGLVMAGLLVGVAGSMEYDFVKVTDAYLLDRRIVVELAYVHVCLVGQALQNYAASGGDVASKCELRNSREQTRLPVSSQTRI